MNRSVFLTLGACALMGISINNLHAGTVYTLNQSNGLGSGPFGTVTVTLTSATTANIVFQANANYKFWDGQSFDLNTHGAVTVSGLPQGYALETNGGPNVDGQGNYNVQIDSPTAGGTSTAPSSVSFTIALQSGQWLSSSDVLTPNNLSTGQGAVAAHMFAISNPSATYYMSNSGPGDDGNTNQSVPEPTTMSLAGIGLVGMIGYALRRRRQKAAA